MKLDEIVHQPFGYKTLFTFCVYMDQCKNLYKNFVISPIFIETLFALLLFGAKEETAQELYVNLDCIICSRERLHDAVDAMINSFKSNQKIRPLIFKNTIYIQKQCEIEQDFRNLARDSFLIKVQSLDFSEPETAVGHINRWVKYETAQKIENFMRPEKITKLTKSIAISAVCFKAKWEVPFLRRLTFKTSFFKNEDECVKVETMKGRFACNFCESEKLNAKVVEVKFQGDASMVIVLPNVIEGLHTINKKMDVIFNLSSEHFRVYYVDLELPKFRIEHRLSYKKILESRGIKKIFKKLEANLTGISKDNALYINDAYQKVSMEINEDGVDAVSPGGEPVCGPRRFLPFYNRKVVVDHPFAFFIKISGKIVFVGKVVDPSQNMP